MKNIISIILLTCFISQTLLAQAWRFQPAKSKITWSGKAAFSAYTLNGSLQLLTADIRLDETGITEGIFIFNMKTIDGELKDLVKHLKSKDFFEVKKFKTAKFDLLSIELNEANQLIASGQLTIKAVTKPIAFPIFIEKKVDRLAIKGKAIINRTDYGITFNSPSFFEKLKDQAIADNFELVFDLLFLKE